MKKIYNVETGITRFYNRYRAHAHVNGVPKQAYFDTVQECRAWRRQMKKLNSPRRRPYTNRNKRRDAKDQDLPIGIVARTYRRLLPSGKVITSNEMKTQITVGGVLVWSCSRCWGPSLRTREEAVEMVVEEKEKMEKYLFGVKK